MTKKIFVGRLPFDFTDEKLQALFAAAGTVVSAIMVPDPKHERSRGFGFVEMSTDAEADAAIQKLNGTSLGDKEIWVTVARPRAAAAPKPDRAPARPRFDAERGPGRNDSFGSRGRGPRPGGSFSSRRPAFGRFDREPGSRSGPGSFPRSGGRDERRPGSSSGPGGGFPRRGVDDRRPGPGAGPGGWKSRGPRSSGFKSPRPGGNSRFRSGPGRRPKPR